MNLDMRATRDINSGHHKKNVAFNDNAWKKRSDGWIKIQEQSNKLKKLRKNAELRDIPMAEIRNLIK